MPTFTSISDILNLATNGTNRQQLVCGTVLIQKNNGASGSVSPPSLIDTFIWDGDPPNGTVPGTVAAPDRSTVGATQYRNATTGFTNYLTSFAVVADQSYCSEAILYDRLLHISGLSGTVTSAQTVGGTLTRNTGGEGNEIWLVMQSDVGSTPQTVTASYTNQAGTASRTTQAVAYRPVGTVGRADSGVMVLPLQDGDTGVRAVASVTLSGSTGTAGSFDCVVARPIVFSNAGGSKWNVVPHSTLEGVDAPIALEDDMCLVIAYQTRGTLERVISYYLHILEKED